MDLPLDKKLKNRMQKDMGLLQDEVMELLYSVNPDFVFHGGTSIWRCYKGNRFSDDLDLYALNTDFVEDFTEAIKSRGFTLSKLKKTENTVFAKVNSNEIEVQVEVAIRSAKNRIAMPFEKMNGSTITVFTLPLEELIIEKALAFTNRKMIRDIYDVYFLSSNRTFDKETCDTLKELIQNFPKPFDEDKLKAIVYAGAIPTFNDMLNYLQGKFK